MAASATMVGPVVGSRWLLRPRAGAQSRPSQIIAWAAQEDGPPSAAESREAVEKEIIANVQVLAGDEPKRGLRRVDNLEQKRAEWRQEVEDAKQWLRDRDIDPQQAYQTWWRESGSKLRTDRKFDNRRNVVRQLGVKIRG